MLKINWETNCFYWIKVLETVILIIRKVILMTQKESSYLLLLITYKTHPNQREAFHKAILDENIQEVSRAEEGNIAYDYFLSLDSKDELLLVEKWVDQASLDLHRTTPHFAKVQALRKIYVLESSVVRTLVYL